METKKETKAEAGSILLLTLHSEGGETSSLPVARI